MDDPISVGLMIVIGLFLTLVAAVAYHIGADFGPTLKGMLVALVAMVALGSLWRFIAPSLFDLMTYFLTTAAIAWWSWWEAFDSIAVNVSLGLANEGLLARLFKKAQRSKPDWLPDTVPDVWYTSWQFKWGIQLVLVGTLIALFMRRRNVR